MSNWYPGEEEQDNVEMLMSFLSKMLRKRWTLNVSKHETNKFREGKDDTDKNGDKKKGSEENNMIKNRKLPNLEKIKSMLKSLRPDENTDKKWRRY